MVWFLVVTHEQTSLYPVKSKRSRAIQKRRQRSGDSMRPAIPGSVIYQSTGNNPRRARGTGRNHRINEAPRALMAPTRQIPICIPVASTVRNSGARTGPATAVYFPWSRHAM